MKRTHREMPQQVRQKISQRLKNRTFSDGHKKAISDAMKKYWETIPYNNDSKQQPYEKENE